MARSHNRLPARRSGGIPWLPFGLGLAGALGVVLFAATRKQTVVERPRQSAPVAQQGAPAGSPILDSLSNAVRSLAGRYEVVDVRGAESAFEREADLGRRFTFTKDTMEWTASKRQFSQDNALEYAHLDDNRIKVGPFTIWAYAWEGNRLLLRTPPNSAHVLVLEPR